MTKGKQLNPKINSYNPIIKLTLIQGSLSLHRISRICLYICYHTKLSHVDTLHKHLTERLKDPHPNPILGLATNRHKMIADQF